jgi:hypothetical protein
MPVLLNVSRNLQPMRPNSATMRGHSYSPIAGGASERWREAISQAGRAVGFVHKIKDLSSLVKLLLDVLSPPITA